jgi:hypothetical protein
MKVSLTSQQVAVVNARMFRACTHVEIRRWDPADRSVEVSQFQRTRLIETVKIGPSGRVVVLP